MGFLLLGIAMLHFRWALWRWAILLALVGGIPFAVNFLLPRPAAILAVVIFGVGLLGLGYGLWKSVVQSIARP
jgi:H+/gluconate symporter-like permease